MSLFQLVGEGEVPAPDAVIERASDTKSSTVGPRENLVQGVRYSSVPAANSNEFNRVEYLELGINAG